MLQRNSGGLMATLLDEIIELATDDKQPLTVLLRKCLVLAHQLKNDRLKAWANQELNGYESADGLPEYRIVGAHAIGDFSGRFQSGLKNWTIPPAVLEEKHRDFARTVYLVQAIGVYEDVARKADNEGAIQFDWPANLTLYYQQRIKFNQPMALNHARQIVAKHSIIELVDTIRNRTLNMALELQSELGEQDLKKITPADKEQVDRTITTIIYGGTNVFASDQSQVNANISQQIINVGNREELDSVLKRSGLSNEDLAELSEAEKEDGPQKMGTGVMGWIKKTAPKVLAGGVKIGTEVGQKLLTEWLKQYCGIQ
jgi:AbiTii